MNTIGYKDISDRFIEGRKEIPYIPVHEIFSRLYQKHEHKFLFESKDVSDVYGRLSLIGIDPALQIAGKDATFSISQLNSRGAHYLQQLDDSDLSLCDHFEKTDTGITGIINKDDQPFEEKERSKRKNIAQILRLLLHKNQITLRTQWGLYGAFSYDFIRLFEDIPNLQPANDTHDFRLFLYDTFIFFDHLKERAEIIVYRNKITQIQEIIRQLEQEIAKNDIRQPSYAITDAKFALNKEDYTDMVKVARNYALQGELFEVVFANNLKARFTGEPYGLYLKYREVNPSPYLFYFDFGDESLVGASPEMMVRVENNIVHLRPISGTCKRGCDPIEDHENMLELLSHPKERAELDMLIDLGRNDLSRICKPGLKINDYRFVEKYSHVMHTVAHLSGELKDGYTALDALIACVNAGTLTGAPKVAAMIAIEKHEKQRRGYYGGSIGYLTFSGEMDTGIIIRTAHIKGDRVSYQAGATLLYDSVPEKEYEETLQKTQAFLHTFSSSI